MQNDYVIFVPSLELRHLHLDLRYCHKIVFGVIDGDFFDFSAVNKIRGHPYKLFRTDSTLVVPAADFLQKEL